MRKVLGYVMTLVCAILLYMAGYYMGHTIGTANAQLEATELHNHYMRIHNPYTVMELKRYCEQRDTIEELEQRIRELSNDPPKDHE